MNSIRKAPGKLVILGEFAVVEPGCGALVAAMDRYVIVQAADLGIGGGVAVSSELIAGTVDLDSDRSVAARQLPHIASAVAIARQWLDCPDRGVGLTITSQLHERGVKLGLGSSGAVTAAVVDAVTAAWGAPVDRTTLFRLALIATARLTTSGSGVDVAAAVFGGWLSYRSPDRQAIVELAAADLHSAVHAEWPGHVIAAVAPPPERLLVGWTGAPAATTAQIGRLASGDRTRDEIVRRFRESSEECVDATIGLLTPATASCCGSAPAGAGLGEHVRQFRNLLCELDRATAMGIFTERLNALCAAAETSGAAAKPSGAGGGDCGIALAGSSVDVAGLGRSWLHAGIRPLDVDVAPPTVNAADIALPTTTSF
ncbi:phosphomevalonate kinase [Mycobacterium ulcerans]|uniref:phosphomevalonate kinase n=1 Tax=Mycobacterium ulcerans subsp. shinshuense TaxID=1124626 RepID=A0A1B4Y3X3_MYCUL|nr:phosphomevalonate kinase [Mycobacterium ulcerans]BAV41761.1 phosphomevalonate kinase [Mycobacterium ulcerans subsp. shinshuense]